MNEEPKYINRWKINEEFDLSEKIEILEAKFNDLLLRFTGNYYPHLIDSDENAGEEIRQMIWDINKEFIRLILESGKPIQDAEGNETIGFFVESNKIRELAGEKLK